MSVRTTSVSYRDLTGDEVAFYREHGWVKVDGLISADAAADILEHVQRRMGGDAGGSFHPDERRTREAHWNQWVMPWRDQETRETVDDFLYSFTHSAELGNVCRQAGGREMRYWTDKAVAKMPEGEGGSGATEWHADLGAVEVSPFDPPEGQLQVWIALKDVSPAHGSMRFVPGEQVTDEVKQIIAGRSVEESYPDLERLGVLSPPLHYRPGDATIHGSEVFHSAPPNHTTEPRWGYILSLFPSQARFSGKGSWVLEGVPLEPGQPFPDDDFPVLA